jgi:type IV pilus assembly protein PilV
MKQSKGFTLLEVLVAIVILAIGLIGLVGLQTVSIKNNQTAYYRAIAIQQVYDMADRMRANLAGVSAGNYNNITTTIPANPGCIAAGCSVANVAVTDQYQWNSNNAVLLPAGNGSVQCSGTCPPSAGDWVFDITVSWKERGETGATTHSVKERFRP